MVQPITDSYFVFYSYNKMCASETKAEDTLTFIRSFMENIQQTIGCTYKHWVGWFNVLHGFSRILLSIEK